MEHRSDLLKSPEAHPWGVWVPCRILPSVFIGLAGHRTKRHFHQDTKECHNLIQCYVTIPVGSRYELIVVFSHCVVGILVRIKDDRLEDFQWDKCKERVYWCVEERGVLFLDCCWFVLWYSYRRFKRRVSTPFEPQTIIPFSVCSFCWLTRSNKHSIFNFWYICISKYYCIAYWSVFSAVVFITIQGVSGFTFVNMMNEVRKNVFVEDGIWAKGAGFKWLLYCLGLVNCSY